jgi:hypothetical protein
MPKVYTRVLVAITCLANGVPGLSQTPPGVGTGAAPEIEKALDALPTERVALTKTGEFELANHRQLTPTESTCSHTINLAHYIQDLTQQQRSAAHFDNCAFDDGLEYITALVDEADQEFAAVDQSQASPILSPHFQAGLVDVGRALHAIQDFYAHSNYIELQIAQPSSADGRSLPFFPVWESAGRTRVLELKAHGLTSGTWSLGQPKKCGPDAMAHSDLNKDSDTTPEGRRLITRWHLTLYQVAFATAQRASVEFFKFESRRHPVLASACGSELDYLVGGDFRAQP